MLLGEPPALQPESEAQRQLPLLRPHSSGGLPPGPVSSRSVQATLCAVSGAVEVGRPGGGPGLSTGRGGEGEGRAPGQSERGCQQELWGGASQPWGCPRPGRHGTEAGQREEAPSPRRGINGAARFKFQISPRQMSLGKEQFLFAWQEAGGRGGRHGPSLLAAATAHSAGATALVGAPAVPLAKPTAFPGHRGLVAQSGRGESQSTFAGEQGLEAGLTQAPRAFWVVCSLLGQVHAQAMPR